MGGWQHFSVANSDWIEESLSIFAQLDPNFDLPVGAPLEQNDGVITMRGPNGTFVPATSVDGTFLPLLHYSPPLVELGAFRNYDFYSLSFFRSAAAVAVATTGKPFV